MHLCIQRYEDGECSVSTKHVRAITTKSDSEGIVQGAPPPPLSSWESPFRECDTIRHGDEGGGEGERRHGDTGTSSRCADPHASTHTHIYIYIFARDTYLPPVIFRPMSDMKRKAQPATMSPSGSAA